MVTRIESRPMLRAFLVWAALPVLLIGLAAACETLRPSRSGLLYVEAFILWPGALFWLFVARNPAPDLVRISCVSLPYYYLLSSPILFLPFSRNRGRRAVVVLLVCLALAHIVVSVVCAGAAYRFAHSDSGFIPR